MNPLSSAALIALFCSVSVHNNVACRKLLQKCVVKQKEQEITTCLKWQDRMNTLCDLNIFGPLPSECYTWRTSDGHVVRESANQFHKCEYFGDENSAIETCAKKKGLM
jgi:hypothetical protein